MGIYFFWISEHWLSVLTTISIVSALAYNGYTAFINIRVRKVDTLITITAHHRTIWLKYLDTPALHRILEKHPDLKRHPITEPERIFVNLIILHLATVLVAVQTRVIPEPAGQDDDLREFFSLPIPNVVWDDSKAIREPEIIRYVEGLKCQKARSRPL